MGTTKPGRSTAENWLVVFDHEPGVPWGRVKKAGEGKFEFVPLAEETLTPAARLDAIARGFNVDGSTVWDFLSRSRIT